MTSKPTKRPTLWEFTTIVACVAILISFLLPNILRTFIFIRLTIFDYAIVSGLPSFLLFPICFFVWRNFKFALFSCFVVAAIFSTISFCINTLVISIGLYMYYHNIHFNEQDLHAINLLILPWIYLWTRLTIISVIKPLLLIKNKA